MPWSVAFGDEFDQEFEDLAPAVQDELLATAKLLGAFGPQLGRPHADTLNDSAFANMKELRFEAEDGVWSVNIGGSGSDGDAEFTELSMRGDDYPPERLIARALEAVGLPEAAHGGGA